MVTHPATLTVERLRQLLDYDPATGELRWRARPARTPHEKRWNTRYVGRVAGTTDNVTGYRRLIIEGRRCGAHQVIWAMVTGAWPERDIDHRDGNEGNNEWGNLRLATTAENARNRGSQANNTSGFKGVSWASHARTWRAQIWVGGKKFHLGYFANVDEAASAYRRAAIDLHGGFAKF